MRVKSLSHVRLFTIPWTAAHQAPLSMGFSRGEYWSGVPLPSPIYIPTKTVWNGRRRKQLSWKYESVLSEIKRRDTAQAWQSFATAAPSWPTGHLLRVHLWTVDWECGRWITAPNLSTDFPWGSPVQNLPAYAGDAVSSPWSGRSPGRGSGFPLQFSCLGNPLGRGAW